MGLWSWLYRTLWDTGFVEPSAPEKPKTIYLFKDQQFESLEEVEAAVDASERKRKREIRQATAAVVDAAAIFDVSTPAGTFNIGIVGESYRQAALRKVSAGRRARGEVVTFRVVLRAEPENSHDPNAVRVDVEKVGQIGYLSAEDAAAYKRVFDMLGAINRTAVSNAKLIGGSPGKPSLGAVISLEDPDELIARIAATADPQPF